jgi:hypothetical protein
LSVHKLKAAIRLRDGMRCVVCDLTNEEHLAKFGRQLDVHRTSPGSVYTLDGCVTVCRPCHGGLPRTPRGMARGDGKIRLSMSRDLHGRLQMVALGLGLRLTSLIRLIISEHLPEYERRAAALRKPPA